MSCTINIKIPHLKELDSQAKHSHALRISVLISLLIHILLFLSITRFLPSTKSSPKNTSNPVEIIPIKLISNFQKNTDKEPVKEDKPPRQNKTKEKNHSKSIVKLPVSTKVLKIKLPWEHSQEEKLNIPTPKVVVNLPITTNQKLKIIANEVSVPDGALGIVPVKVEKQIEKKTLQISSRYQEESYKLPENNLSQVIEPADQKIEPEPYSREPDTKRVVRAVSILPNQINTGPGDTAIEDKISGSDVGNPKNPAKKDAMHTFMAMVRNKIEKAKSYPRSAKRRGHEGIVGVKFRILPDGNVLNVEFDNPSGKVILNKAARQAIQNAAPFTPWPEGVETEDIKMKINIAFRLK